MSVYDQAIKELMEGIPGLPEMSLADGLAAIDNFVKGWQNPSLSFNPGLYFQIVKHEQRYAQTVNGW